MEGVTRMLRLCKAEVAFRLLLGRFVQSFHEVWTPARRERTMGSPQVSPRFEVKMIAEAKQQYRGVLCTHCRQPIPLSPSAELKERESKERPSDLGEFFSITLRCRVCHDEGIYTQSDVIDLDGAPRKRNSQAHKNPRKHSRSIRVNLPDLTKPIVES